MTQRFALAALACLLLAGCATQTSTQRDPRDPFERVNRATYRFNDALDRAVAKPVARTYRRVTPRPVQTGVSNFFDNLGYPIVIVNDLLQAKFKPAARDTGRLLLNTTLGLGGIFDPASRAGLEENDEDFGQTLGRWGVPTGPYLMLPVLGPSTIRDGIGSAADQFANPRTYIDDSAVRYGLVVVGLVDTRARLLDVEGALEGAYDRYAVLRSAYLQRREYLVHDGDVPEEPVEEFNDEDPPE